MGPEEIGHAGNGIIVVEKIDTTVTITISTIVFNIGGKELWNADGALAGADDCEGIYVIFLDVVNQSLQLPVTAASPFCESLGYNSRSLHFPLFFSKAGQNLFPDLRFF